MTFRRCCPAIALALLLGATPLPARDFGVHGTLFAVDEPSLLDTIKARLTEMEAAGEMETIRREMQDKTRARVTRPRPVQGLSKAVEALSYAVDLSVTLERDLADQRGQVFARAGTRINPLAYSGFNKRIILFDGDDPDQLAFALEDGSELDTILVLTAGDPLALMRAHGRRFWFDQDGVLTARFQIRNLPAVVTRADPLMRVEEVPVTGRARPGESRP